MLAGRVAGRDATIAGVGFTSLEAAFGGTLQNATIGVLRATGGWGRFAGHGGFSTQQFAAYGAYRGTFEGLRPLIGDTLEGRGPIAGTVGIAIAPPRIVVQGSHLAMRGASLRGVPIDDASMTLAISGDRMRVYSANARTAGGDLVAAGTFALGPAVANSRTNALALVANGLHASQLHGIGLPLDGGTLSATGTLSAGAPLPSFAGGVVVAQSRFDRFTMTGNGDVRLAGTAVALQRILGALGGTYANVNGRILDLTSRAPGYAIDAAVPAAQIVPALHSFGLPNYMMDGTFNARLHVAGRSATPNVSGSVGVPAGEINGLPFINGAASLAADARGVSIRNASVLVGTTQTYFSAEARPHDTAIALRAPRADLSDFNNFFDTGDTLDGNGTVELAAASRNAQITSTGENRRARVSLPELADRRYQSELVERAQRRYRGARRRRQRGDAPGEGFDRPCACVGVAIDAVAFTIRLGRRGRRSRSLALDAGARNANRADHRPCLGDGIGARAISEHGTESKRRASQTGRSDRSRSIVPISAFTPPVAASSSIAPRSRRRRFRRPPPGRSD